MKPHVCPLCGGDGVNVDVFIGVWDCLPCKGTGVVWEPEMPHCELDYSYHVDSTAGPLIHSKPTEEDS